MFSILEARSVALVEYVMSKVKDRHDADGGLSLNEGRLQDGCTSPAILAQVTSCFSGVCQVRFGFSLFLERRRQMPRRGWTTMEVPDGWLQLFWGPRPKSERWPLKAPQSRQKPASAVRQTGVHGMKGPTSAKSTTDAVRRVSPDLARKARKLEKALEVMSDVDGPAVEAVRAELKVVQNAASVPTVDVQIQQCESFIIRSERRLAEIDAQRVAEQESLTEGRARLERLRSEAAQCADRQDSGSQVASLQQMVNLLQSERDALAKELQVMCATEEDVRPVAKKQAVARLAISHWEVRGVVPLMPRHVPNDVMSWLQDRKAEQHDALMMGDLHHVTELGNRCRKV